MSMSGCQEGSTWFRDLYSIGWTILLKPALAPRVVINTGGLPP
jgi:hypothetical protein